MTKSFICYLCDRAGRKTLAPRRKGRGSRICQDCAAHLTATGRAWCPTLLHVVPAADMGHSECRACNVARCRARHTQPPAGYVPLADLVRRLAYSRRTLGVKIAQGWMAGHVWRRGPGCPWYVEDRATYPAWPDERRGPGRTRGMPDAVALCHPGRKHRALGLCDSCYMREWRKARRAAARPEPPPDDPPARTCEVCGNVAQGRYCDACRRARRQEAGRNAARHTHCIVCKTAQKRHGPLCEACFQRGLTLADRKAA